MRIYLGHGASGGAASMAPWIDGLQDRGIDARALTLPRGSAERALAAFEEQVPDTPDVAVGGHSFGGRVASMSAAGVGHGEGGWLPGPGRRYAALVCLSYPLHRPGAPDTAPARTGHWPRIACPALLLTGTRDPFATLGLLEAALPSMPGGRLVTYNGLGHGLLPVREDVLDRIAVFLGELEARGG